MSEEDIFMVSFILMHYIPLLQFRSPIGSYAFCDELGNGQHISPLPFFTGSHDQHPLPTFWNRALEVLAFSVFHRPFSELTHLPLLVSTARRISLQKQSTVSPNSQSTLENVY